MFIRFISGVSLILVMCVGVVMGAPSITGPTGLITIPSAHSLKYKEYNVGVDYLVTEDDEAQLLYKANLGTFQSWELGIVGGSVPREGVFLNLKYYLMSDSERFPMSVAIGAENLSSSDQTNAYMVASKTFSGGLTAHFGFRANFGDDEVDPTVMGGMEYFHTNELSSLVDFDGEQKNYRLNVGVRYLVNDLFSLRAAVVDVTSSKTDPQYTIGFSFSRFLL